MNKIALLTTTAVLAVGGSSAAYAFAASAHDTAPVSPSRAVTGAGTSGIASPSFVRTSAGVKPVEVRHHGRHAEPGDDHGRHRGGHGSDD